jgi:hypothetical protein
MDPLFFDVQEPHLPYFLVYMFYRQPSAILNSLSLKCLPRNATAVPSAGSQPAFFCPPEPGFRPGSGLEIQRLTRLGLVVSPSWPIPRIPSGCRMVGQSEPGKWGSWGDYGPIKVVT